MRGKNKAKRKVRALRPAKCSWSAQQQRAQMPATCINIIKMAISNIGVSNRLSKLFRIVMSITSAQNQNAQKYRRLAVQVGNCIEVMVTAERGISAVSRIRVRAFAGAGNGGMRRCEGYGHDVDSSKISSSRQ
jgi:hypothetical protein